MPATELCGTVDSPHGWHLLLNYMGLWTALMVGFLSKHHSIKVEKEPPGNFPFVLLIFNWTFVKC